MQDKKFNGSYLARKLEVLRYNHFRGPSEEKRVCVWWSTKINVRQPVLLELRTEHQ